MAETSGPIENVLGVVRTAAETATEFKTIADKFIADWGLAPQKESATAVSTPGRPSNAVVNNYASQTDLDQSIKKISSSLSDVGTQIKGLFNLAYPSAGDQTAAPMSPTPTPSTGGAGIAGISPIVWLIAGAGLLLYLWRKK
jgi:hypothetical protein